MEANFKRLLVHDSSSTPWTSARLVVPRHWRPSGISKLIQLDITSYFVHPGTNKSSWSLGRLGMLCAHALLPWCPLGEAFREAVFIYVVSVQPPVTPFVWEEERGRERRVVKERDWPTWETAADTSGHRDLGILEAAKTALVHERCQSPGYSPQYDAKADDLTEDDGSRH